MCIHALYLDKRGSVVLSLCPYLSLPLQVTVSVSISLLGTLLPSPLGLLPSVTTVFLECLPEPQDLLTSTLLSLDPIHQATHLLCVITSHHPQTPRAPNLPPFALFLLCSSLPAFWNFPRQHHTPRHSEAGLHVWPGVEQCHALSGPGPALLVTVDGGDLLALRGEWGPAPIAGAIGNLVFPSSINEIVAVIRSEVHGSWLPGGSVCMLINK